MHTETIDFEDGFLKISNPQATIYAYYELGPSGNVLLNRSEGLSKGTKLRWKQLAEEKLLPKKAA